MKYLHPHDVIYAKEKYLCEYSWDNFEEVFSPLQRQ